MSNKSYYVEKNCNNETSSNLNIINQNFFSKHEKLTPKRVNIVSLKMLKESSILYANRKITSPIDASELFKDFLENNDREMLLVCCLDSKNQPTSINTVSIGTLTSSLVHPREVFKTAILGNAASILVAHNHPSGDTTPSKEDLNITNRLKEASKIIGIDLIDHLIIGNNAYTSLKEIGAL